MEIPIIFRYVFEVLLACSFAVRARGTSDYVTSELCSLGLN